MISNRHYILKKSAKKLSLYLFLCITFPISFFSLNAKADAKKPNNIDYSMYFLSDVRDNPSCTMTVENGKIVMPSTISNPAMTCPDMTSWRLFTDVVRDKFWSDWPDEVQNWPQQPWPLCKSGDDPAKCCTPGSLTNSKDHCPIYPGALISDQTLLKSSPHRRVGRPSITHQLQAINTQEEVEKIIADIKSRNLLGAQAATPGECPASVVNDLVPKNYESIGRVVRQTNSEVTVRNRSFHNYIFENNLYNSNGIADVFTANAKNQLTNAPYAALSQPATKNSSAALTKIDFPADAIMIKSNWLYEGIAKRLNIQNTKENPFITQKMTTAVQYTDKKGNAINCSLTGTHYLMAFHISSKDTPNWVWTSFEHVAMPGRCDITGCNDSYGYTSSDNIPAGSAKNYVAPHVKSDDLVMAPSIVFDRDKLYAVEKINSGLDVALKNLGIGTTPSTNKDEPAAADSAWRNYRLKGSQVEFVNSMGRKTILGNSITEAGFVDGSSCITCHARAGIHLDSQNKANFFKLSVFIKDLSEYGYGLSAHKTPNPNWYNDDDNAGTLNVLQTDFVWGFFNANPLAGTK